MILNCIGKKDTFTSFTLKSFTIFFGTTGFSVEPNNQIVRKELKKNNPEIYFFRYFHKSSKKFSDTKIITPV